MNAFDRDGLHAAISELPEWWASDDDRGIERELEFRDFASAIAFIAAVAIDAQAMDHHPDWSNSYNRVAVRLTTHAAGGVTERDLELARRIDARAAALLPA